MLRWQGACFLDRRLPFALSSIPAILILLINILLLSIFVTYLTNLIARSVQALLVVVIWAFFIILGRNYPQVRTNGWNWIIIGLNLIAFGLIISICDHVFILRGSEALHANERYRLFLEQVVGCSLGFALLAYGFFKWVPSFLESKMVMTNYLHKLMETVKLQKEELIRAEEKSKQAEEIHRLQEFNEKVLSTIPSSLLVLSRELVGLSVNWEWVRTFAIAEEKVRGRTLKDLIPSEQLVDAVREAAVKCSLVTLELPLKRDNDADRWFDVKISGEPKEMLLCVFDDITERRRTAMMEKQLQGQLLQSEKLSALGELVSGVAHEFNNPLAIISGYSELLMEEDELSSQTKELMQEIGKSSFRCKKIVENLLAFARQHKPERELVDINQIVKDALALRAHQFRVDNIKGVEELGRLPPTVADPHQLQQVFFNIINNGYQAVKGFRREGGELIVRTKVHDGMIRVEVCDNGPGIPAALVKRIFDPFFTTKKLGEGTGLGLSITYGIIKEHHGKISVESVEGQGATFHVDLPISLDKPISESVKEGPDIQASKFQGKKILVIDDETNIAEVCRMGLERLGCAVQITSDGPDAIARIERESFDLIISDIRMPGMDGPAIYSAVRQRNPELASRIIFMTGDTLSPQTKSFLDAAGNIFINKPFVMEELKAAVARHIDAIAAGTIVRQTATN
ncbi:MAG: response regulator [Candidatus Wallbacteria bacterium]|nr:response regulator [Candidatus Wallbacteria bacterium]